MPFFAMELLHGEALSERMKRGPLPVAEILRIGKEIALGLEAAHAGTGAGAPRHQAGERLAGQWSEFSRDSGLLPPDS